MCALPRLWLERAEWITCRAAQCRQIQDLQAQESRVARLLPRGRFLPEALLNYLGTMGWSIAGDREKFTLQEMIDAFSFDRISLGGPVFDLSSYRQ